MSKIDTSGWRIFRVEELFETEKMDRKIQVPTGSWIASKNLMPGSTPRITVSGVNNGITGYYKDVDDANYRVYKNFISVSFLGTVFYQASRASLDMKVHCLKPLNIELNERVASFLVTMIKAALGSIEYSDQISSTVLPSLELMLPVDASGEPNWAYMDEYMSAVLSKAEESLMHLRQADGDKHALNIDGWRRFHLYDESLFDIDMGTKLDRVKMTQASPDVNFVGRANTNNGITAQVDSIAGITPYEAGNMTLSLGGEYLGSCFVQPERFYTSQNVVVLIPRWDIPFGVKQFIATMVFRESRLYYKAFIDELNRHIKTDFSFYLPVDAAGKPNWAYMDEYMQATIKSSKSDLLAMQSIS